MSLSKSERTVIAKMVKPVWSANQPEAADRSIALGMLTSNLQHEERADKRMIYDCGTLTPDEIAEGKAIWRKVAKAERGTEHKLILDIVNEMEW